MKIACILTSEIQSGGGFDQSINAIKLLNGIVSNEHEYTVYTNISENIPILTQLDINSSFFKFSAMDYLLTYFNQSEMSRLCQRRLKILGNLEKLLLCDKVDIVYFLSPTPFCLCLQKLNYVTTVWDLCHWDYPQFSEVRKYGTFHSKERLFKNALSPAVLVITDSEITRQKIATLYGVDLNKILAIPFSPGLSSQEILGSTTMEDLTKEYTIEKGFLFYPAQFWPHKNHIRIIQALKLLKDKGMKERVVFCGGDKGTLGLLHKKMRSYGVSDQITVTGFVSAKELRGLYEMCKAVIIPSYFGPTNIPPLEAWHYNKPLIYSAVGKYQAGDAALLFDPNSLEELADCIRSINNPGVAKRLITNGNRRLNEIDRMRRKAEQQLNKKLKDFSHILDCLK